MAMAYFQLWTIEESRLVSALFPFKYQDLLSKNHGWTTGHFVRLDKLFIKDNIDSEFKV